MERPQDHPNWDSFIGVRLFYRGSILHCNRFRTREENRYCAQRALSVLTGVSLELLFYTPVNDEKNFFISQGGHIQYYRETGG